MYLNKIIAIVIPAYNEEKLIEKVVKTLPTFIDHIIVIDDFSTDATATVVNQLQQEDSRISIFCHDENKGVGAAIATGYKYARDNDIDVAAVMAADFQMDPKDLPRILEPVCSGKYDYSKGNRLFRGESWDLIPKHRYIGNSFLSLFTKIASGYWHIADSQSGYTAISLQALKTIDLDSIYPRYGMPNDILIKLNIANFRVKDVSIRPVYNVGEISGIKVRKVLFTIPWLLFKGFWKRMLEKYVIRDFHPLVFFYALGFFFVIATFLLGIRLFYYKIANGYYPPTGSLATMFSFISANQFILFAMWFDMEANKDLK